MTEKGLYLSTKYMINHGHTEIAFAADYEISSSPNVLTDTKKLWRTVHIPFRPEYLFSAIHLHMRAEVSEMQPCHCRQQSHQSTAVVTTADICALSASWRCASRQFTVSPIDLSVIGYDNLNLCQYTVPKLTSVSQNVLKKPGLQPSFS